MPESDTDEFNRWVQRIVCAELSSINHKLNKLMTDVCQNSEKLRQTRPGRSPVRATIKAAPAPFTPRDSDEPSSDPTKLNNARTKIRFVGALVAAAKRARKGLTEGVTTDKIETGKSGKVTNISSRSFAIAGAQMMGPGWDSEAGQRMERIQKYLDAHRSKKDWRMRLWQLTESPFSSKLAFTYAWMTNILVICSVVFASQDGEVFHYVQLAFEVLFAIELFLRFICCPHRCAFLGSLFNWIDLLSIVPLGFRFSASNDDKAVLALVPMLRLFKPLRRFEKLRLLVDAFRLALEALPVLLYTLALIAIVFAEIIYFVEPRSNIPDLSSALWFTIVTMTTVGYGDATPTTTAGHVAASALMVISALYMAMPLGIIGDTFSRVWADRDRLLVIKRFRSAFLEGGFSLQSFQEIFSVFDEDGNGALNVHEFALMLKTMQMRMSEERINVLYGTLDHEGAGEITLEALISLLAPKALAAQILEQGADQALDFIRRSTTLRPRDSAV